MTSSGDDGDAEPFDRTNLTGHSSVIPATEKPSGRWLWIFCALVGISTFVPYIWGAALQGAGPRFGWYSWFGFNFDDSCVYLSWIRQAADLHLFQQNLFTTSAQGGYHLNLLFALLGILARLVRISPLVVWHAARMLVSGALLYQVWLLTGLIVHNQIVRRWCMVLTSLGSGLGWVPGLWNATGHTSPIDVWQPEAVTYLSMLLNPLFVFGLLGICGFFYCMLRAEHTSGWKLPLFAGLWGFLLANVHGYDAITVLAVWSVFLLVLVRRSGTLRRVAQFGAAAVPTLLSAGYELYLLRRDSAFASRVAVSTLSPAPYLIALGFGLLIPLALLGWMHLNSQKPGGREALPGNRTPNAAVFFAVWAMVNVAMAWAPVPFQRKLLMGAQIPLAILAGVGLHGLLVTVKREKRFAVAAALLLGVCSTNVRFLLREITNTSANMTQSGQRAYLYGGERLTLAWISEHAAAGAIVQPLPWIVKLPDQGGVAFFDTTLACLAPSLTGHFVNVGHWGETPQFAQTMGQWRRFLLPATTDLDRIGLLRATGVKYLLFSQTHAELGPGAGETGLVAWLMATPPPYLRRIPDASNADATLFEVVLPPAQVHSLN